MTKTILTHLCAAVIGFMLCGLMVGGTLTVAVHDADSRAVEATRREPEGLKAGSADDLAAKLSPHVQNFLTQNTATFVAHAGNPLERMGIRLGMPLAVRETPTVVGEALDFAALELNRWSISDVVAWLSEVVKRKQGLQASPDGGGLVEELRALKAKAHH